MDLKIVDRDMLDPALKVVLPPKMDSKPARLLLLTIGLVESNFEHRVQLWGGPARGYWQFERGGGVAGVMRHPSSNLLAEMCCRTRQVPFTRGDIWKALATDDVLAACFARLLLWTDPHYLPLPEWGPLGGWNLYLRTWRPGRPRPEKWEPNWLRAKEHVYAEST